MGFFTSKIELTKKEQLIANCIKEALIDQSSEIHCDSVGKRYAIFNEKCHFRMTLVADSYMIRITNTISNDGEKYREKFINHIIKLIVEEKHKRMDQLFGSVEDTMLRLANEMYQALHTSNKERINSEYGKDSNFIHEPVTWENAPLEARIEAMLGINTKMSPNNSGETVIG